MLQNLTDRQQLLFDRLVVLGEWANNGELPMKVLEIRGFGSFPAHRKHRAEWTSETEPSVWLAVFYIGLEMITTTKLISRLIVIGLVFTVGCSDHSPKSATTVSVNPSEDVSHLLVKPDSASGEYDFDAPRDYLPDANVDWVVTVEFAEAHGRENIEAALGMDWQQEHGGPTIFGFPTKAEHWTYVFAADAPESFDKLKIAWPLWDGINEKPKAVTANELEQYRNAAENALKTIGEHNVATDRPARDAIASVQSLSEVVATCDQDVTLWLRASNGNRFGGRNVWDVMLCLGLDYGDGDLFHWINNSGFGDDHFFSVQTSTPPGYFIPQRMADGNGDIDDLMFNFSIPRSADPVSVFDSMVDAIKYAQKRLDGEIVTDAGESFDESAERARIKSVVKELNRAGFVAGDSSTCRVF